MNNKKLLKTLNEFRSAGYDQVSLSELLYQVKGFTYVKDIMAHLSKLGFNMITRNSETFILLKPAAIKNCSLPVPPAMRLIIDVE